MNATIDTPRRHRRWQRFAAAGAGGALLAGSAPPSRLGLLAYLAIIPLFWAWEGVSKGFAARLGFFAGVVYFMVTLAWIRYFGALALILLVAVMATSWAAVGFASAWLRRTPAASPWSVAACWVVAEGAIGRFPLGGFPWNQVGLALHDFSPARALAGWGGVPLVTFVVVALNGFLFQLGTAVVAGLRTRRSQDRDGRPGGGERPWFPMARRCVASLVVLAAVVALGTAARFEPRATGTMRYALVQGNDRNRYLTSAEMESRYIPASHFRLAAELDGRYDLVVLPESSMDADPRTDAYLRREIRSIARRLDAAVLVNGELTDERDRTYNANLVFDPDGQIQGIYAKQHLVPFGEYVPWRAKLDWFSPLDQVRKDLTAGRTRQLFRIARKPVGTAICFESSFAPLISDFVSDGAELIVITTNNRSYRRSANSSQHLAMSQMRAAETGRPIAHAAISGITGVIDATGRVQQRTRLFERTVVTGSVVTTTGRTPYVRFGDWVTVLSLIALACAAVANRIRSTHHRP